MATRTTAAKPKPKKVVPALPPPGAKLLRVDQAAYVLNMSRGTLYRHAMRGEVPSFKVGGKRLFSVAELDRWIERQIERQSAYA